MRTVVIPAVTSWNRRRTRDRVQCDRQRLPVTLLLGVATGLKTLSFRVWDRYAESLWRDAGLAGLIP